MYKSLFILVLFFVSFSFADVEKREIKIAVASNFYSTLLKIKPEFENKFGVKLVLVSGSSGKLYSMISNGAPFDIFLSADNIKNQFLLNQNPRIKVGVYAQGKLAFWKTGSRISKLEISKILKKLGKERVVIPNPKTAPYGMASMEIIGNRKLTIVYSESVSQAFSYIKTGNLKNGFVALSHLIQNNIPENEYRIIQEEKYSSISQGYAVIKDRSLNHSFIKYLENQSLSEFGYY